jgi:hypothetical protein
MIDYKKYLARPTIFLLIDDFEKINYGEVQEDAEQIGVETESVAKPMPEKFHEVIKESDVYYSAIKYAYSKGGSVKIFKRNEDMKMVSDGDSLVYVGGSSQKVAIGYKDAYKVEVFSGRELRERVKGL